MLPNSWKNSLRQLPSPSQDKSRIAIVGIGNPLRSDDAVGCLIARQLMQSPFLRDRETILVLDAGHAPENRTADLRRFAPDTVLLIDAAQMGELPGAIRWIEVDELDGMSASTHTLPLGMLAKYLTLELQCRIALLGIQPRSNDVGEGVSEEVLQAVNEITEYLIGFLASDGS